jgi:Flp pilus assembly protein protease CpaA
VRRYLYAELPQSKLAEMLSPSATVYQLFLVPLAVLIIYHDVRYRRIPNPFVLATLISGLTINFAIGGLHGGLNSIGGCVLAFILMFILHVFGAMGAGDVKLFAAIGSSHRCAPGAADFRGGGADGWSARAATVLRIGAFGMTMHRVLQILVGLLPGWQMPKFSVPADRRLTIPYGAAITIGAIIATAIFHA